MTHFVYRIFPLKWSFSCRTRSLFWMKDMWYYVNFYTKRCFNCGKNYNNPEYSTISLGIYGRVHNNTINTNIPTFIFGLQFLSLQHPVRFSHFFSNFWSLFWALGSYSFEIKKLNTTFIYHLQFSSIWYPTSVSYTHLDVYKRQQ